MKTNSFTNDRLPGRHFQASPRGSEGLWALPWRIANLRDIAVALRSVCGCHFPGSVLGDDLVRSWRDAGGERNLPIELPLAVSSRRGEALALRLDLVPSLGRDFVGRERVRGGLIVGGVAISLERHLTHFARLVAANVLSLGQHRRFLQLAASAADLGDVRVWRSVLRQRFDAIETWSVDRVWRTRWRGSPALVFGTGERARGGEEVCGIFFAPDEEGRFSSVEWRLRGELSGAPQSAWPLSVLPAVGFDVDRVDKFITPHFLEHSSRWLSESDVVRLDPDAALARAGAVLEESLALCRESPDLASYGWYDGTFCDRRAGGDASPIVALVPACFSANAAAARRFDAAFACRCVGWEWGRPVWFPATVLRLSYAWRSARVIGRAMTRPWMRDCI